MNKRGSMIAESAVVFPVVIFTVVSMLYLMIYFYMQVDSRVDMHMVLRAEGGYICDNIFYGEMPQADAEVTRKAQQLHGTCEVTMDASGPALGRSRTISAEKYLIDEAEYLRMTGISGESFAGEE